MKLAELKKHFQNHIVFSTQDVRKFQNNFDLHRFTYWVKKGYLQRITRNYYCFSEKNISEYEKYSIANAIYHPSYISLEMALRYYNLIPEEVFLFTSVSTKKTTEFKTPLGNFSYKKIKEDYFFGYNIIKINDFFFKIATIEKAIIDYLYLNAHMKTEDDFFEMRINVFEFMDQYDEEKLWLYAREFKKKTLLSRLQTFLSFIKKEYDLSRTN